jgi:Uma2 family endonuclease
MRGPRPDTVRGADLVFISKERYARCQPDFYVDVAPELVIEVLSPGDRRGDVQGFCQGCLCRLRISSANP